MKRIALSWLAVAGLSACASTETTDDSAGMARCPVCEEKFVRDLPPSDCDRSSHGLMPRYLSEPREAPRLPGEYFPGPSRVLTCPHCLYSAGEPTFADLDREEQERLQKALAGLSLTPDGDGALEIVRICEKERRPDARRELYLELHAYFSLSRERTMEDRKRLRALLVRALAAGGLSAQDRARLVYLAGEISHQMGRGNDARRLFGVAIRLADVAWVPGWARAQLRRIEMESLTAGELGQLAREARPIALGDSGWAPPGDPEIALQALARRDDPDAWAILADFVGEDVEKLHALVRIADLDPERMRLAPDLHSFAEDRYCLRTIRIRLAPPAEPASGPATAGARR